MKPIQKFCGVEALAADRLLQRGWNAYCVEIARKNNATIWRNELKQLEGYSYGA